MRIRRHTLARFVPALLFIHLAVPGSPRAELQPAHIAILANANSPESLDVAQHYAQRRRIPPSHIIPLPLPDHETLTREEYDHLVVLPLRLALEKHGLASTVRVLVTTYGVPLRVDAPVLSTDEKRWLLEAQRYVRASRTGLEELDLQLKQMTPGLPTPEAPADLSGQAPLEMARTASLLSGIERTLRTTLEHQRSAAPSPQDRQRTVQLVRRYGGWGLLLRQGTQANEPIEFAAWRSLLEQTGPLWATLGRGPISTQRPLIYRWAERLFGLRGVLELASAEVDLLTTTYADASLDSELSLLWWDRDLYPVAWRWGNPLLQDSASHPDDPPILMVSRLDAPTADLAKGLVDQALQAEHNGLQGTVYFDARGLNAKGADTYALYDQSLRDAAEVIRKQSSFRVVLDNADATLSQPGAAPDVAIYIGWYRLRSYEDAFTFKPGAIGYHMASAEAVTVHDPAERGWCKNALERGITATLGSVGEPYLDAFPEPARFTALLLTGKYSLAEVYYLTSRYVSWRMVLFGDPLYNPMRGRSPTTANHSIRFPTSPSERLLGNPPARLELNRQEQQERMAKLAALLREAERGIQKPGS
jgi:uncharacterized protein (TIGR03790 family)